MIRILHVVPNMNAGGIETFLMNIYRQIDKNEFQFDFLVHYKKRGFYDDEIESLGGRIYRLDVRENHRYFKYITDLNHFFDEHKEYEIVHGHMNSAAFIYMGIAKRKGVHHRIVHSHGDSHENNFKGWMKYFLFKLAKIYATDCFACSYNSGKYLFGNKKFTIIRNSIVTSRFSFDKEVRKIMRNKYDVENKFVIGCVARFDQQKNHRFLINVFSEFLKINNNAVLWLIGAGPLESDLKELCSELIIEDKVAFLGVFHDVEKYYQAMDVFALTSNFEGLGIVTIEAQCSGLPVFVSENIPEEAMVTDNITKIKLSEGPKKWAEIMYQKSLSFNRSDKSKEIINAGFDAVTESRRLISIYKEMIEVS